MVNVFTKKKDSNTRLAINENTSEEILNGLKSSKWFELVVQRDENKWRKWKESELFAFNAKMLLQAMRKIQSKMDTNRHGKERDTDGYNGKYMTKEGKERDWSIMDWPDHVPALPAIGSLCSVWSYDDWTDGWWARWIWPWFDCHHWWSGIDGQR